jgi:Mg-chelatase subunit ChlD
MVVELRTTRAQAHFGHVRENIEEPEKGRMRFTQPLWLLLLLLLPVLWWIQRRGLRAVSDKQSTIAGVVRSVIVIALALSLAGATLWLSERTLATVFVLDVSDSIGPAARDAQIEFVSRAVERKPAEALAGVIAFGRDPRVELSMSQSIDLSQIASRPDRSRTDLARALRLAAAVLPEGTRRRIVVLSDGRENSGDGRAEAARLERRGIRVDTIAMSAPSGPDASVVAVKAPSRARTGEEFDIEVSLESNTALNGRLIVYRQGQPIDERSMALAPGETVVKITEKAGDPGAVTYRAELSADRDSVAQNDSGAALVIISGPPTVLVLEGGPDEGTAVARALSERGFTVDRRPASFFPAGEELAATDAIVLVDVEAGALTDSQLGSMRSFVRELGRGLVAIGGESSWSLGGYRNTALEDLLPLESEIKDPKRRPSVAQVLAIDTSGSMAACHCAGPNMGSSNFRQGPNKTDISRSAAARAIDALTDNDEVGVLAFNTGSKWILPLGRLPSDEVVRNGLSRLNPNGGTSVPQALHTAAAELKASRSALKHIILFTDGWTRQEELPGEAAAIRKEGITISVVATGEGAGDVLARVAEEGGGRFYAGRNLEEIPEIFMSEVMLASRRYVNEGEFYPKITGPSAATRRIESTPPLLGYVGTTAKPSAAVLMSLGELDDPLLATWRTGLGIATAWTSDAKPRWASHWVGWERFADFWSDVVRETLPAAPSPGFSTRAAATDEGVEIIVEAESPFPEGVRGTARIVEPDGRASTISLARSGAASLSGLADSGAPGAYLISVDVTAGGSPLYRETIGSVRAYSAEYRGGGADETLLRGIAKATSGRFGIDPGRAFDADLPSGSREIEIAPWLLLLAALLLPLDIALRRVVVTREDLSEARGWRPSWLRRTATRSERMDRLLRAKYRVRQADTTPGDRAAAAVEQAVERSPAPGPRADNEDRPSGEAIRRAPTAGPPSQPPADSPKPSDPTSGAAELLRRKRARNQRKR